MTVLLHLSDAGYFRALFDMVAPGRNQTFEKPEIFVLSYRGFSLLVVAVREAEFRYEV